MSHHRDDVALMHALADTTGCCRGGRAPNSDASPPPRHAAVPSAGEAAADRTMAPVRLRYRVRGVHCGACRSAIRESVGRVPGVADVHVDIRGGRVTVDGQDLDDTAIRESLEEAGYSPLGWL